MNYQMNPKEQMNLVISIIGSVGKIEDYIEATGNPPETWFKEFMINLEIEEDEVEEHIDRLTRA